MQVAHGPYNAFYSIHLVEAGYSKKAVGWLWALGVVAEIALFLWLPRLMRAWSLRQILLATDQARQRSWQVMPRIRCDRCGSLACRDRPSELVAAPRHRGDGVGAKHLS